MAITIERGKIQSIRLGMGGYQDAMFGFSFTLGGKEGWGVSDFLGTWAHEPDKHTKWTLEDRNRIFLEHLLRVKKLMEEAGINDFTKLKGIPIEATFEDMTLKSWRIMTEVL